MSRVGGKTLVAWGGWVRWSVTLAAAARIALFIGAIVWPIANERGARVSPLLSQGYLDFQFYLDSLHRYLASFGAVVTEFMQFYAGMVWRGFQLIAGPVFPLLLGASGYSSGHLLPLSLGYVVVSSLLAASWIIWLSRNGVRGPWLAAFAVLPNAVWFTLIISPDLLFAAEFAVFYFAYTRRPGSSATALWVAALLLMLLTRPNAFSILLFVAADTLVSTVRTRAVFSLRTAGTLVLVTVATLYLYPYFLYEMNKAGGALRYFGATPNEYLGGLFHILPPWLDVPISAAALVGAKVLYFVGLRPTYGQTALVLVFLRAVPGVILLPGLLSVLARGPNRDRALVFLFCLPIILGPSQDRYYLAIYPLLYLYGVRFYEAAWQWMARARAGSVSPAA